MELKARIRFGKNYTKWDHEAIESVARDFLEVKGNSWVNTELVWMSELELHPWSRKGREARLQERRDGWPTIPLKTARDPWRTSSTHVSCPYYPAVAVTYHDMHPRFRGEVKHIKLFSHEGMMGLLPLDEQLIYGGDVKVMPPLEVRALLWELCYFMGLRPGRGPLNGIMRGATISEEFLWRLIEDYVNTEDPQIGLLPRVPDTRQKRSKSEKIDAMKETYTRGSERRRYEKMERALIETVKRMALLEMKLSKRVEAYDEASEEPMPYWQKHDSIRQILDRAERRADYMIEDMQSREED